MKKAVPVLDASAVAFIAYEAMRAFTASINQLPSPHWEELDDATKNTLSGNVLSAKAKELDEKSWHEMSVKLMKRAGWKYGPRFDDKEKRSPNLVEFEKLPTLERAKLSLFFAIVNTMYPGE